MSGKDAESKACSLVRMPPAEQPEKREITSVSVENKQSTLLVIEKIFMNISPFADSCIIQQGTNRQPESIPVISIIFLI